jgi:hypothetical protein
MRHELPRRHVRYGSKADITVCPRDHQFVQNNPYDGWLNFRKHRLFKLRIKGGTK